ncbi:MAG: hypothetical protein D6680_20640 [Cyanobacteria bacterium J007]|nr:MAG: hypothetical protein D6680_20640 [Cyanobacteria bacterium J007]
MQTGIVTDGSACPWQQNKTASIVRERVAIAWRSLKLQKKANIFYAIDINRWDNSPERLPRNSK